MKDKILWIILALFVLVSLGLLLFFTSRPKNIENIKTMRFGYSNGWSRYGYVYYDLYKENDEYYVTIKPNEIPEEEAQTVKLSDEQLEKLYEILNKYHVSKWNKFHKTEKNVLDGDSFSFYLHTEDGIDVSASGYMRWPNNYHEVKNAFYELFDSLYEYKEDKVY